MKVKNSSRANPVKEVVNIYTFEEAHFDLQALQIKRLFRDYNCAVAVIDANGLGIGLVDALVKDTTDPDTGEFFPNLGVVNDDKEHPLYDQFRTNDTIIDAMYLMKANATINTQLYSYAQTQLRSGRVAFLWDEAKAKNDLLSQSTKRALSAASRNDLLRPYVETSILGDQMLNLIQDSEGVNIVLRQQSRTVKKDKFSAFIYALYWPMIQETTKRSKKISVSRMFFFTKGKMTP